MNMENLYFILVPVVLIVIVLTFKFFKMEEDYREKSMEIQQKIEELKKKNDLIEDKKITIMTDPDAVVVALNAAHNAAVPEPETAETEEEPKKDE